MALGPVLRGAALVVFAVAGAAPAQDEVPDLDAGAAPIPSPPPTEPPPPPVESYHVVVDGISKGPFLLVTLEEMIEDDEISLATLVWKPGMAEWRAASAFPELVALIAPEQETIELGRHFLVGIWEGSLVDERGVEWRWKVRYEGDGAFIGSQSRKAPDDPRPTVDAWEGTWTARKIDDTSYVYSATETVGGRTTNTQSVITYDGAESFVFETTGIRMVLLERIKLEDDDDASDEGSGDEDDEGDGGEDEAADVTPDDATGEAVPEAPVESDG